MGLLVEVALRHHVGQGCHQARLMGKPGGIDASAIGIGRMTVGVEMGAGRPHDDTVAEADGGSMRCSGDRWCRRRCW